MIFNFISYILLKKEMETNRQFLRSRSLPEDYKRMFDETLDEMDMEACGSKLYLTRSDVEIQYSPVYHLRWKRNNYNHKGISGRRQFLRSRTM